MAMATLKVLMMMILLVNLSLPQGSTDTREYECNTSGCGLQCSCKTDNCSNSNQFCEANCDTEAKCDTESCTGNGNISISYFNNDSSCFCQGTIHLTEECYIILNQSNTSCTEGTSISPETTICTTSSSSTSTQSASTAPTTESTTTSATPASTTPGGSTLRASSVVAIVISFTILVLVIVALIVMIVYMHWRFRVKVQRERSYNISNGRADTSADLAEVDNKVDPLYSVIEDTMLPPLPPPNCYQTALNKDAPAPSQPSHHHSTLTPRYADRELAIESATQYEQPIESLRFDSQDKTQGARGTGGPANLQVDMVDLQPYEQPARLNNSTQNGDLSHRCCEAGTKTTEFTEKCDFGTTGKEGGLSVALAGDAANPVVRIDIDKNTPASALQVLARDTTDPYDRVERIDTNTRPASALQVLARDTTDPYDRVERIDTNTRPASALQVLEGDTTDPYDRVERIDTNTRPASALQVLAGDITDPYDRVERIDTNTRPASALQVLAGDTTDPYDRVERIDTNTSSNKSTPASALQVLAGDTDPYDRVNTNTASKETPTPHHLTEFTLPESDYAQLNSGADYATLEEVKT